MTAAAMLVAATHTGQAAEFTLAGYTFDTSNTVRTANFQSNIGYASPSTGQVWPDPLYTIGNLVDGGGITQNLDLTAGASGNDGRTTITMTFTTDTALLCRVPNLPGEDLVVYEAGSTSAPEAFAVSVRQFPSGVWTPFRYEFADDHETSPGLNSGHFSTGFDLTDFGVPPDGEIDAVRIVNLHNENAVTPPELEDRVVGLGEGIVLFDVGSSLGSPILRGPQSADPDTTYPNSSLDADITYVASLHDLLCDPLPPEPPNDCFAGPDSEELYYYDADDNKGVLTLATGIPYTMEFPSIDGSGVTSPSVYRVGIRDTNGGEEIEIEVEHDAIGAGGHLLTVRANGTVLHTEPLSTGTLPGLYDLQLVISQISAGVDAGKWTVDAAYRSSGGGSFTQFTSSPVSDTAFDLTEALLFAAQDGGPGSQLCLALPTINPAAVEEVFVDDDFGPGTDGFDEYRFDNLRDAVDTVSSGGRVSIASGHYPTLDVVVVDKAMTISGPQAGVDPRPSVCGDRTPGSPDEAIIDGQFDAGTLIFIAASDVTIEGIEVKDGTGDLIQSPEAGGPWNNIVIQHCIIHGSTGDDNIQLRNVTNSAVRLCHSFDAAQDAINISNGATSNTIEFNECHDCSSEHGLIYVYDESANTDMAIVVRGNLVYNALAADGIKIGTSGSADFGDRGGLVIGNTVHTTADDGIEIRCSGVSVVGNLIYNVDGVSSSDLDGGIVLNGAISDIEVSCNTIHDNPMTLTPGIKAGGVAVGAAVSVTSITIEHNNFSGNIPYALYNDNATTVVAADNYWGAPDGPNDDDGVVNGSGDAVSTRVAVLPFSTVELVAEAVLSPNPLDFGDVDVGSSEELPLTVDNVGTCPLIIDCPGLVFTGPDAVLFEQVAGGPFPLIVLPGESAQLTVRYTPDANCETDIATGTLTTSTGPLTVRVQGNSSCPNLLVQKFSNGDNIPAGIQFSYTVQVINNGSADATSVTVVDTLPEGVVFVSASAGCSETSGVVTCEIDSIAPQAAAQITIDVIATTGGLACNEVTASVAGGELTLDDNQASACTTILPVADLAVEKFAEASAINGQATTFTIVVTNFGPDVATSATIVDVLPGNATLVDASAECVPVNGTLECQIGPVGVGESTTLTVVVIPNESDDICNTAFVAAAQELDLTSVNNGDTACVGAEPSADVAIVKLADPDPAPVGSPLTYTLLVTNNGPDTATSVTVVDNLPPSSEAEYIDAFSAQGSTSESGGDVISDLGALAPGATTTVTIIVKPLVLTTLVNGATVTAEEFDPDTQNNSTVIETRTCNDLVVEQADTFPENPINPIESQTGWWSFVYEIPGFAETGYDEAESAIFAEISPSPDKFRVAGLATNLDEWLPYQDVGDNHVVRGQFFLYGTGDVTPGTTVTMPNLRVRLSNRVAVNSMLEVFTHLNGDPEGTLYGLELRPSTDSSNPSIYTVDFDPVDVPFLVANGATEGIMRAFEAYSLDPQDDGQIALVESVLMTYPSEFLSLSSPPVQVYAPSAVDAGNMALTNPSELSIVNIQPGAGPGDYGQTETTGSLATHSEGSFGVTLDSANVPTDRVAIASREFFAGADLEARPRVEEDRQYVIRWHVTSTQQANLNSQLRLRARSAKFMWSTKYEVGGAWATGLQGEVTLNNAIAQQALPGIGTQNPDKYTTETQGGFYNMVFMSPLDRAIRPEFDPSDPLIIRMPLLAGQPGPGVDAPSRRDINVGFDLVDTISGSPNQVLEEGNFTVDRIEIRDYPLVNPADDCSTEQQPPQ